MSQIQSYRSSTEFLLKQYATVKSIKVSRGLRSEKLIIFLHDMEKCLEGLDAPQRCFVDKVAIEGHSVNDAGWYLKTGPGVAMRTYAAAIDALTVILARKGMLRTFGAEMELEVAA